MQGICQELKEVHNWRDELPRLLERVLGGPYRRMVDNDHLLTEMTIFMLSLYDNSRWTTKEMIEISHSV
jgi:hypothetical protein